MLRSSFFNDPFFGTSAIEDQMRQMDNVFSNFGMMDGQNQMAPGGRHRRHGNSSDNRQVAAHGAFMDPFSHFNSMFSNMQSMMTDMRSAFNQGESNGDSHVFQQSSFMSYSNTGNGAPKVYQATSSSRQGPNGVRETKKTVRDSEADIDKIAVGHHIRDRGHVIERTRRGQTGDINENQEYINLDEDEASEFDQEYQEKWKSAMRGVDQRRHVERYRHAPIAGNRRPIAGLPEPDNRRPRKTCHRRE